MNTITRPVRILLVVDEDFHGEDFIEQLRSRIDPDSETVQVFVIVPALVNSALEDELGAIDGAVDEAEGRLQRVMDELAAVGIDAVGKVGDGHPVTAVGDGLREFEADHIFVVAHPDGERRHAERGLWERLNRKFSQPMVEMLVSAERTDGHDAELVDVKKAGPKVESEEERIPRERNFPPLRTRDAVSIVVGIGGTILLGLLAVAAGLKSGEVTGKAAAVLLIAIGSFLLNVAHVVGILLFEAVRYGGIWERFMYRTTLIYTLTGLAVATVLWLTI